MINPGELEIAIPRGVSRVVPTGGGMEGVPGLFAFPSRCYHACPTCGGAWWTVTPEVMWCRGCILLPGERRDADPFRAAQQTWQKEPYVVVGKLDVASRSFHPLSAPTPINLPRPAEPAAALDWGALRARYQAAERAGLIPARRPGMPRNRDRLHAATDDMRHAKKKTRKKISKKMLRYADYPTLGFFANEEYS
jgi:hypothetical protein